MSKKRTVHPYYQAILDAYAALQRPAFHQVSPREAREMLRTSLAAAPPQSGLPEMACVTDGFVAGTDHQIPIRRYRPTGEVKGLCLYFHAGGWVIGDLDTGDALCRRLAAGAACEVVSVDYRLAPEHPFPAALHDAIAAVEWVTTTTDQPLVLVGESAGGNIAAAAVIHAQQHGWNIAGQFLAYPVTDHDFTTASYRELGSLNYLLSEADMRWFWNHYCPPEINRDHVLVSPLRIDDASGLPSTLIYVAELDPLREEGLAYGERLKAAGVEVLTRCDEGMLHGYLSAAGSVATVAQAVEEAAGWIKTRIQASS